MSFVFERTPQLDKFIATAQRGMAKYNSMQGGGREVGFARLAHLLIGGVRRELGGEQEALHAFLEYKMDCRAAGHRYIHDHPLRGIVDELRERGQRTNPGNSGEGIPRNAIKDFSELSSALVDVISADELAGLHAFIDLACTDADEAKRVLYTCPPAGWHGEGCQYHRNGTL